MIFLLIPGNILALFPIARLSVSKAGLWASVYLLLSIVLFGVLIVSRVMSYFLEKFPHTSYFLLNEGFVSNFSFDISLNNLKTYFIQKSKFIRLESKFYVASLNMKQSYLFQTFYLWINK